MHTFTLPESTKTIGVLKPATDAAGRTGRYVAVLNLIKLFFVFHIDQGNAATIACDLVQASDKTGTGVKVLTGVRRIWSDLDVATSDTLVRQTDALSYTTDAGVKEKHVIIELDPSDLDLTNGFVWVAPRTGASNAANLTQCTVVAIPSYAGAGQPSVTT